MISKELLTTSNPCSRWSPWESVRLERNSKPNSRLFLKILQSELIEPLQSLSGKSSKLSHSFLPQ